jgi:hypothetical protein
MINEKGCFIYCYLYHKYKHCFSGKNETRDAENVINYSVIWGENKSLVKSIGKTDINEWVYHNNIDVNFPMSVDDIPKFEK